MEKNKNQYTFAYDGENFTTMLDGEELVGCQWVPKDTPVRYVMIFFHGLGAFLSINRSFFPAIVKDGGAIFGTDHLGHGRSPGDRGNNTSEMLFDEITLLLSRATVLYPDIPIFVYGHSMGGVAILSYVLTHPKESEWIEGVIVEAPWINTSEDLAGSIVHKIVGKFGRFLLPSLIVNTGNGFGETQYPKQFIDTYQKSNLPHDFITPRLYASAYEMQEICNKYLNKWPQRLPLLFMQGGKDISVGVEANLQWVDRMRDHLGGRLRVAYHKDAEHAMLRTKEGPIVIDECIDFINHCLTRPPDPQIF